MQWMRIQVFQAIAAKEFAAVASKLKKTKSKDSWDSLHAPCISSVWSYIMALQYGRFDCIGGEPRALPSHYCGQETVAGEGKWYYMSDLRKMKVGADDPKVPQQQFFEASL